eukprot:comp15333_c0_seq1/m.12185 comp15333_c0_seq1/g.12185  ORF comp15333_c0_seq1/g.12185 comp15333_c0_seq1/m.12185 type:complete len:145 (-) comp15333_c0_seq1:207-641(-)
MNVINPRSSLLSNFEVYEMLKNENYTASATKKENKKHPKAKGDQQEKKVSPNVVTITYEVIKYLEETPAAQQTADSIEGMLAALQKYNLTRPEKLMIINLGVSTIVDLHVILEECEERLSEEHIAEIIDIVKSYTPEAEGSKDT